MPRPLPVTTATLPSRFIAPTLMSERNRPLCELDLHVFAARLIPGLPVDRVRDRVGCICEEHGALDAGPLERVRRPPGPPPRPPGAPRAPTMPPFSPPPPRGSPRPDCTM